jgi:hypothetical protein
MADRRSAYPKATCVADMAIRNGSLDPSMHSFDYCNSFWGFTDDGVEVLLARMRSATRTMEEIRSFWKERCDIVCSGLTSEIIVSM